MAWFTCEMCASMGDPRMVESDSAPADDEHKHGWRDATPEEAANAKKEASVSAHEDFHKGMGEMKHEGSEGASMGGM